MHPDRLRCPSAAAPALVVAALFVVAPLTAFPLTAPALAAQEDVHQAEYPAGFDEEAEYYPEAWL